MEIVHKLIINCGMTLGAWMRGVIRLMSKNPAAAPVDLCHLDHNAGHIHFKSIGTSFFVSAQLVLMNSFAAFFLRVILDLVVEAVFPVPIRIVPRSQTGIVWNVLEQKTAFCSWRQTSSISGSGMWRPRRHCPWHRCGCPHPLRQQTWSILLRLPSGW
jgi:hypothetical protein